MRIDVATHMALETRRQLQEQARAIGVSESYVSLLVDAFYDKVRSDPVLGPVFDDVIQDHWAEHLDRMKLFWTSIALRTGTYRGYPMPVHKALTEARPEHFDMWLDHFRSTLEETAPNQDVIDYFMEFANAMGERLSRAMFS